MRKFFDLPRLRLDQFYWQNGKKMAMLEASIMSASSRKNMGRTKGNHQRYLYAEQLNKVQ